MQTLDVLIPSFRVDAEPLLAALNLIVPDGLKVRWIIVVDDPTRRIPDELAARIDDDIVRLLRNDENIGSAGSRNAALDESTADWVLFLDDDVHPRADLLISYCEAVANNPDVVGFFGPTEFEPAASTYQRGVEVSDILTFFWIARHECTLRWAPTSNVLVRGDLARAERFRTIFPKAGGGEDIDYLLRVSKRGHGVFHSVPSASVNHPWWFAGRRDYSRFIRWSHGDSLLHVLHPEHTYRSPPNAVEVLFVLLPVAFALSLIMKTAIPAISLIAGVILGELVVEFVRLSRLKSAKHAIYCIQTVLIRSSNDVGRLLMQIRMRRPKGLAERWDHFCNGEHVAYHKRWAVAKCVGYAAAVALVALVLI